MGKITHTKAGLDQWVILHTFFSIFPCMILLLKAVFCILS